MGGEEEGWGHGFIGYFNSKWWRELTTQTEWVLMAENLLHGIHDSQVDRLATPRSQIRPGPPTTYRVLTWSITPGYQWVLALVRHFAQNMRERPQGVRYRHETLQLKCGSPRAFCCFTTRWAFNSSDDIWPHMG